MTVCVGTGMVALDAVYAGKRPRYYTGGSCGNVLCILAYLGEGTAPVCRLGKDPEGDHIMREMQKYGMDTRFVHRDGTTPRIIERYKRGRKPGHKFYVKCEHGRWLAKYRPYLAKEARLIPPRMQSAGVFYFDRPSPGALIMARMFRKNGCIIYFEPQKITGDRVFKECAEVAHILKYSEEAGEIGGGAALEIITRGAGGLECRAPYMGRKKIRLDAIPAPRLVDEAGSGDWISAALISGLLRGMPDEGDLGRLLETGRAMAAINCGYAGARGAMYNMDAKKMERFAAALADGRRIVLPDVISEISAGEAACSPCVCGAS